MGLLVGDGEGEARDLQWCPRGGVSRVGKDEMDVDGETTRDGEEDKLGVLAGVFTDGKVKVFVVPTLEKVRENQGVEEKDQGETVYGESILCPSFLTCFSSLSLSARGTDSER